MHVHIYLCNFDTCTYTCYYYIVALNVVAIKALKIKEIMYLLGYNILFDQTL